MTRLFALTLVLALVVVAIPAIAQTTNPSTNGPTVSVTFVPAVSLRGADYNFGSVETVTGRSVFDPNSGSGVSNLTSNSTALTIVPTRRPMIIFAVESGEIKNGLGIEGSGWSHSATGTAGSRIKPYIVSTDEGGNSNRDQNVIVLEGRGTYPNVGGQYEANSRWNIRSADGGVVWYHDVSSKASLKFFAGVAWAQISRDTAVTESDTSASSGGGETYSYFDQESGAMAMSAKSQFSGFGPAISFTADVRPTERMTIHSALSTSFIFGKSQVVQDFSRMSETSSVFSEKGVQDVSHRLDNYATSIITSSRIVIEKIQLDISVRFRLGRGLELGAGFFTALFRGVPQSSGSFEPPATTTPTLAGATATLTYRW